MANKTFSSLAKGAYAAGTAYTVGDFVTYLGASYACILNSTGNVPTNTTYWALLASKGDTGSTGATGATGATGPGGNFTGPGSSTDNAIHRFDGTTGALGQNSGITIADGASGTLSGTNTGDQTTIVGITGTTAQFNTANTDGDFATLAGTETLSGKTLTAPKFADGGYIGDANGAQVLRFSTTASANNDITIKNASSAAPQIQASGGDTNISINLVPKGTGVVQVGGVVIPTISSTNTLTNKRVQPRILSAASYTTNTGTSLNIDNLDIFIVTAQAGALLFNAPGGTLAQGEKLTIRIKDNGTARALTWDAVFRAMGTALPSTTVVSKTLYLGFIYNSTDTKWDLVASAQEA